MSIINKNVSGEIITRTFFIINPKKKEHLSPIRPIVLYLTIGKLMFYLLLDTDAYPQKRRASYKS